MTIPQVMAELGKADKTPAASSDRQEARKRAKRGEVFGLVCFRFGLAPSQLAALPDETLVKCFAETTGRSADVLILKQAAAEYADAHRDDHPVWLTLRASDPAAAVARREPAGPQTPAAPLRLTTTTRLELLAEAFRDRGVFVPIWPATVGATRG